MNLLPTLNSGYIQRDTIGVFGGYNNNLTIQNGQFYDMSNLTSSYFPALSPREKRRIFFETNSDGAHTENNLKINGINGIIGKKYLVWTENDRLWYWYKYDEAPTGYYSNPDGAYVHYYQFQNSYPDRKLISMGAYVVIFPDKVLFNTETGKIEKLEEKVTINTIKIAMSDNEGNEFVADYVSATEPKDPENEDIWLDVSDTGNPSMKKFSEPLGLWMAISSTYIKIISNGKFKGFSRWDGITISGFVDQSAYVKLNTDTIIYHCDDDSIVVPFIFNSNIPSGGIISNVDGVTAIPIVIERKVPDMEFFTESENRIWGCSSEKHEIYACAVGDPKNWNKLLGISTDSYSVTVGSDGDFTGAITHLGYILFFKENCIHKIYGNKPSNYQITNNFVRGIEKGSEKSIAIVNETLYYKSKNGIVAYDGSLPTGISDALGLSSYKCAVAGSLGNKYYVSMQQQDGKYVLFSYDERIQSWFKEDNTKVKHFVNFNSDLFYIDNEDNLKSISGTEYILPIMSYVVNKNPETDDVHSINANNILKIYTPKQENTFEWFAETGDIGQELINNSYISKLQLKISIDKNSYVELFVQYDSNKKWDSVGRYSTSTKKTISIPIIPLRCDHMKLKLQGKGDCKLYSITKTVEKGSEL